MDKQALESTKTIVGMSWFPSNPEVLSEILTKIEDGTYAVQNYKAALLNDLKKDFALYSFCLKELIRINSEDEEEQTINPSRLMQEAGIERLAEIVMEAEKGLSKHSYDQMGPEQAKRFHESMVSASAAEVLAEHYDLDPELGFTTALLRQLGLTLLAWNYPKIFERAAKKADSLTELHKSLTLMFGFSPTMLAVSMAREWNLTPAVRSVVGDKKVDKQELKSEDRKAAMAAETLHKICQVGETLARANNPERYPKAREDWKNAKQVIEDAIGAEGMWLIKNRILENCEHYLPEEEYSAFIQVPEIKKAQEPVEPFERNLHIRRCPEPVRKDLRGLYDKIQPNSVSKDNILALVKKIVPGAGFLRGCIYSFDPAGMNLFPSLAIGSADLSAFPIVDVSPVGDTQNFIRQAYESNQPLIEEQIWTPNQCISIAAVFGQVQRAGVLYLETSPELALDEQLDSVTIYRALNQALVDCLKLH